MNTIDEGIISCGLGLLLVYASVAAPAPLPRSKQPEAHSKATVDVKPGKYLLHWGGAVLKLTLRPDGTMFYREGCTMTGTWKWYPASRTLLLIEALNGSDDWWAWEGQLDSGLRGTLCGGNSRGSMPVKLIPE